MAEINVNLGVFARSTDLKSHLDGVRDSAKGAGRGLDDLTARVTRSTRSSERYGSSAQKASTETRNWGRSMSRGAGQADAFGAAVRRSGASAKSAGHEFNLMDRSVLKILRSFALVAAASFTLYTGINQIRQGVRTFAEFENSMSELQAVTGATSTQLQKLNDKARELGRTTEFTARQAAEAQVQLGRAGFSAAEALSALEPVLNLATVGNLSMARSAELSSIAMRSFGFEASEMSRVASIFATTSASALTTVEQMGQAFKYVAPIASAYGQSLEVTAAAAASLANRGLQDSMAGTGLKKAMSLLVSPTAALRREVAKTTVSLDELNPRLHSWEKVLPRLRDALSQGADAIQMFGQRGGPAAEVLAATADETARLTDELGRQGDTAKEMSDIMRDNLAKDGLRLKAVFEDLGIAMSEGMAPQLRITIGNLVDFFAQGTAGARQFGADLANALDSAAKFAMFLLENIRLITAAVKALIGYQLARWLTIAAAALFTTGTAGVAAAGGLTAASAAATKLLAVGRVNEAMALLNMSLLGTGSAGVVAGGGLTAAGKGARFLSLALTPLTVGLTIVAGGILLVSDYVESLAQKFQRDIDDMVQATNAFADSIKELPSISDQVIKTGDGDKIRRRIAEFTRQLDKARDDLALAEKERDDRQFTYEKKKKQMGGRGGPGPALEKLNEANLVFTNLKTTATSLETEIDRLFASLGTLKDEVTPEPIEVLDESVKRLMRSISDLNSQANEIEKLTTAAAKGGDGFEQLARAMATEQRARSATSEATQKGAHLFDQLTAAIRRVASAEELLAGTKMIVQLQEQQDGLKRLASGYRESLAAGEAVSASLAIEADVRKNVAEVAESQMVAVARLTRLNATTDLSASFEKEAAAIAVELDFMEQLEGAYENSAVIGDRLVRQLEDRAAALDRVLPLTGRLRDLEADLAQKKAALAQSSGLAALMLTAEVAAIQSQVSGLQELRTAILEMLESLGEAQAKVDQDRYLAGLKDETSILKVQQKALEKATVWQRLLGTATRDAAIEAEVHRRILAAGALGIELFADEVRKAVIEQLRLNDSIGHMETFGDRLFGFAGELADALGESNGELRQMVSQVSRLVQQFQQLKALGKEAKLLDNASLGVGIGGAIGGLGSEDSYAAEGGALGGLVGGIVGGIAGSIVPLAGTAAGVAIGAAIGGAIGTLVGSFIKRGVNTGLGIIKVEGGQLVAAASGKFETEMNDMLEGIMGGISDVINQAGGTLISGPNISTKLRKKLYSVFLGNLEITSFDVDKAVEEGVLAFIRMADIGGLSPEVSAALKNSTATTLEQLQSDIQIGLDISKLGVPEFQQGMQEATQALLRLRQEGIRLGIDVGKVNDALIASYQDYRDQILGITKTEDEKMREEAAAYNAERAKLIASSQEQLSAYIRQLASAETTAALAGLTYQVGDLGALSDMSGQELGLLTERLAAAGLAAGVSAGEIQVWIDQITSFLHDIPAAITEEDLAEASRRRRSGGGGNRRQERIDAQKELDRLSLAASGLSSSAIELRANFAQLDEWIDGLRKLGFAEEALAQARQDQLTVLARDFMAPFEEILAAAGETELETSIRGMSAQYESALETAYELAVRAAELNGTEIADEFAKMADTIGAAFGVQIGELLRDDLSRLVDAGDLAGLRELADTIRGLMAADLPPELRAALGDLPAFLQEVTAAITELLAVPLDFSPLQDFVDAAEGLSDIGKQLREIDQKFADFVDAAREAGRSEEELSGVHDLYAAAVAQVRQSVMDSMQAHLDYAQSIGATERSLMDGLSSFDQAIADIKATLAAEGRDPLAGDAPGTASPIGGRRGTLRADTIADFVDELERAGAVARRSIRGIAAMNEELAALEAARRAFVQKTGDDFLGSLNDLGAALPTDVVLELAHAQWQLAKAEAVSAALALEAAGYFQQAAITLNDVLTLILLADFDTSKFNPSRGTGAGGGNGGGGGGTEGVDDAIEELLGQIDEWRRLGLGPVTNEAIDLRRRLDQLSKSSAATGEQLAELDAAFQIAVDSLLDSVIDDLGGGAEGLQAEFESLVEQFVDAQLALEALGASADQVDRLNAAWADAIDAFVERATAGLRAFADELRGEQQPGAPNFASDQSRFQDLLTRAQGGDLEALELLEDAARDYRAAGLDFLGGGVGFQELINQILAGIESVSDMDLVPEDIALLREQRALLESLRDISELQPTADGVGGGFGGVENSVDNLAKDVKSRLFDIVTDHEAMGLNLDTAITALGLLVQRDDLTAADIDRLLGLTNELISSGTLTDSQLSAVATSLGHILSHEGLSDEQLLAVKAQLLEIASVQSIAAGNFTAAATAIGLLVDHGGLTQSELDAVLASILALSEVAGSLSALDIDSLITTIGSLLASDLLDPAQLGGIITSIENLLTNGNLSSGQLQSLWGIVNNLLTNPLTTMDQTTRDRLLAILTELQSGVISAGIQAINDRESRPPPATPPAATSFQAETILERAWSIQYGVWNLEYMVGQIPHAAQGLKLNSDGLVFAHAGERILSQQETKAFEAMALSTRVAQPGFRRSHEPEQRISVRPLDTPVLLPPPPAPSGAPVQAAEDAVAQLRNDLTRALSRIEEAVKGGTVSSEHTEREKAKLTLNAMAQRDRALAEARRLSAELVAMRTEMSRKQAPAGRVT